MPLAFLLFENAYVVAAAATVARATRIDDADFDMSA